MKSIADHAKLLVCRRDAVPVEGAEPFLLHGGSFSFLLLPDTANLSHGIAFVMSFAGQFVERLRLELVLNRQSIRHEFIHKCALLRSQLGKRAPLFKRIFTHDARGFGWSQAGWCTTLRLGRCPAIRRAKEGFEIREAKGAEMVAQRDHASEPRGPVLAFTHAHEREVEPHRFTYYAGQCHRRQQIIVPNSAGKGLLAICFRPFLIGQRADGEPHFPMMRGDDVGYEVSFSRIGRAVQQPRQCGGEFMTEAAAFPRCHAARLRIFRLCIEGRCVRRRWK
jgi:hypothetical protein